MRAHPGPVCLSTRASEAYPWSRRSTMGLAASRPASYATVEAAETELVPVCGTVSGPVFTTPSRQAPPRACPGTSSSPRPRLLQTTRSPRATMKQAADSIRATLWDLPLRASHERCSLSSCCRSRSSARSCSTSHWGISHRGRTSGASKATHPPAHTRARMAAPKWLHGGSALYTGMARMIRSRPAPIGIMPIPLASIRRIKPGRPWYHSTPHSSIASANRASIPR